MSALFFESAGWWPVFGALSASLLGSVHCLGMCGGISALAGSGQSKRRDAVLYQGARLGSYTLLGMGAGTTGAALLEGSFGVWLSRLGLSVLLVMLISNAWQLLRGESSAMGNHRASLWFFRSAQRREGQSALRALLMGIGTALLPCGWLHGFLLAAAATGSGIRGAVLLFAFGLGTLPALASSQWVARSLQAWVHRGRAASSLRARTTAAALLWLVLGGLGLAAQAGWLGSHAHHGSGATETATHGHAERASSPSDRHHAH